MNRFNGAFVLIALAAVSVAAAQTSPNQSMTPQQSMPSSQYPSETNPPASTSQAAKDARKQQMKDCMAQQQANNTGKSKKEMKEYCKNQVTASPQG